MRVVITIDLPGKPISENEREAFNIFWHEHIRDFCALFHSYAKHPGQLTWGYAKPYGSMIDLYETETNP